MRGRAVRDAGLKCAAGTILVSALAMATGVHDWENYLIQALGFLSIGNTVVFIAWNMIGDARERRETDRDERSAIDERDAEISVLRHQNTVLHAALSARPDYPERMAASSVNFGSRPFAQPVPPRLSEPSVYRITDSDTGKTLYEREACDCAWRAPAKSLDQR